jgi:hypothetical protein
MRKGLFAVIVLTAVAVMAALLTANSPALIKPGTIRLTTRAVKQEFVDRPPLGRGAGDLLVKRELLFNKGVRAKAIGYADVVCTHTSRYARQCSATYALPKGKIVVAGAFAFAQFHELAVIGGTGLYDNVRGTLTVTLLRRNPQRDILVFRLVV